jgi:hypothetical protein
MITAANEWVYLTQAIKKTINYANMHDQPEDHVRWQSSTPYHHCTVEGAVAYFILLKQLCQIQQLLMLLVYQAS